MEPAIGDGTEELLHTYTEDGGINYLAAAAMLPSRSVIDDACAELMSLMFPGFRGEPLVASSDLPQVTKSRLRNLQSRLKPEFCKSLGKYPPDATVERRADELLARFFSQLPPLRKMLWTDIDAAYEGDPAAKSYEEIILAYPALEAIAFMPKGGFRGMLRQVEIPDILQLECLGRKSSILEITGAKGTGRIFIQDGTIIHAEIGSVLGEPALDRDELSVSRPGSGCAAGRSPSVPRHCPRFPR
jgi:hypothetical protein